jgi:hypothetical protein
MPTLQRLDPFEGQLMLTRRKALQGSIPLVGSQVSQTTPMNSLTYQPGRYWPDPSGQSRLRHLAFRVRYAQIVSAADSCIVIGHACQLMQCTLIVSPTSFALFMAQCTFRHWMARESRHAEIGTSQLTFRKGKHLNGLTAPSRPVWQTRL